MLYPKVVKPLIENFQGQKKDSVQNFVVKLSKPQRILTYEFSYISSTCRFNYQLVYWSIDKTVKLCIF